MKMFEIIDLFAMYLRKQKSASGPDSTAAGITPIEDITLNVDKKFLEILKSSFKVLNFSLDETGKFSQKDYKIFKALETKILKILALTKDIEDKFDNNIALALTLYNSAVVYTKIIETVEDTNYQTEKEIHNLYAKADHLFTSCLCLLKFKELDSKVILTAMRAVDKISSIWIKQEKFGPCYSLLLNAIDIYVKYTKEDKYLNPVDVAITLGIDNGKNEEGIESDTKISLDNLHIENLKKLSTLYNHNLDNKHEYVIHMHNILNNLIKEVFLYKRYMEWAMATAELSRYFIRYNRFTEARNYLSAAVYMIEKYSTEKLATIMAETTIDQNKNQALTHLQHDLLHKQYEYEHAKMAKLWGQYGIQLLWVSKQKLLQNKENQSCEADNFEQEHCIAANSEEESANLLIFADLKEELKEINNEMFISDKYLLNFNDIKTVFKQTLKWFNMAIAYFTIEKDIKTYGKIILYMSIAYKNFADFEQHQDKQITIYEQQIVLLNSAVKKLSSNITINTNNVQKLMWLELGISYATIVSIMNDDMNNTKYNEYLNERIFMKMKYYIYSSMDSFLSYLQMS